jgi:hypothetical protein
MDFYQYKLLKPLKADEVESRRSTGATLWAAQFDHEGRILSAKNLGSGTVSQVEYTYENGRLLSIREHSPDGKVRERLTQK